MRRLIERALSWRPAFWSAAALRSDLQLAEDSASDLVRGLRNIKARPALLASALYCHSEILRMQGRMIESNAALSEAEWISQSSEQLARIAAAELEDQRNG